MDGPEIFLILDPFQLQRTSLSNFSSMKSALYLKYLGDQGFQQPLHRQGADLQALWVPFKVDVGCVDGRHGVWTPSGKITERLGVKDQSLLHT